VVCCNTERAISAAVSVLKVANTISARPSPVTEVPIPVLQSRRLAKCLIALGLVTRAMWIEFRLGW
jgi:hypothetical protein